MAALATAITDIFEPGPWTTAFIENTTNKNVLIQSGIAVYDPDIDEAVSKGGRRIEMPFFQDLAHDGGTNSRSKIADDTDTKITPDGVDDEKDEAYSDYRTQSWQVGNIVKYAAGQDPAMVVLARYVSWWVKEEQRILISKLKGIFATALAGTHVHDIALEAGLTATVDNLIGATAIETARFKLGDAYDSLTAIAMHSTPFQRLRSLNLITFVPLAEQNLQIPYFMGLRVIVDDKCLVVAGTTSGYKYHTYLFGQGSIARVPVPVRGSDKRIALVEDDKAGNGAGSLDIVTRNYFVMHPRGIAFTGTPAGTTPTNTELETGSNWTKKYQSKNIRLVCLITNG